MIILKRFINRWQIMVSQLVLYNRIGAGKRGVNVVKTEFALASKDNDGIGISNVKMYTRRQYLQLLQVFVRAISSTGNHDEEICITQCRQFFNSVIVTSPDCGPLISYAEPTTTTWVESI
ncbi:unnamed protein product [Phytophthora lilii]|uniref:Unnamed protein product n=1 Tax=Phytophthora lilii TaxID=2077276 RepID=A0A9W7CNE7_9STRA|nr:unnamed protein product [Phytophthora lilii]